MLSKVSYTTAVPYGGSHTTRRCRCRVIGYGDRLHVACPCRLRAVNRSA
jgi:hypothetical protein